MKNQIFSYEPHGDSNYFNVIIKDNSTGKTWTAFLNKCSLDLRLLKEKILSPYEATEKDIDKLIELAKEEQIQDNEMYV